MSSYSAWDGIKVICDNCGSLNLVKSIFWVGVIDCTSCGKTLHNRKDEKKREADEGVEKKPPRLFD